MQFSDYLSSIEHADMADWVTVFAYLIAAAISATAASKASLRRERRDHAIWRATAILMIFLGINELLDLQTLLTVIGRASTRIPTVSFTMSGMQAEKVAAKLADARIGTVSGVHGGSRLLDALGVNDEGGAVTIGLAPYTTRHEIDQLGRALSALE